MKLFAQKIRHFWWFSTTVSSTRNSKLRFLRELEKMKLFTFHSSRTASQTRKSEKAAHHSVWNLQKKSHSKIAIEASYVSFFQKSFSDFGPFLNFGPFFVFWSFLEFRSILDFGSFLEFSSFYCNFGPFLNYGPFLK